MESTTKSPAQLMEDYKALKQQMEQSRALAVPKAIAQIKELMATFEITFADLGCSDTLVAASSKAAKPKALYREPNGVQIWNGRGRKPKWFEEAIKQGITREQMEIN